MLDEHGIDLEEAEQRVKERLSKQIEQVEKYTIEFLRQLNDGELDSCPICLESADSLAITKCKSPHVFCGECIVKMRDSNMAMRRNYVPCPMCR